MVSLAQQISGSGKFLGTEEEPPKLNGHPVHGLNMIPNPEDHFYTVEKKNGTNVMVQVKELTEEVKNRKEKFEHPPSYMVNEVSSEKEDYKPRIGILT